ncbi:hypothetical protein DFH08DRAFT_812619 [Mycena albidolilacea]|uniref:Novel STAND NTPase 1 domain-containing protein n=1 Tax=Mycena albidolilacea TaxID=1033008 RepID=A0AAD6ZTU0_9AGAR|nr:hypothetical protein DFH08DRAFT_812619 [Mycena albidolilacea]
MPPPIVTQNRLDNVVIGLIMTTNTLQIIADSIQTPFLGAIINTTQAVLNNIQLLEQIHKLLNAIMILHIKSDAGGEMPIEVLDHVGKFREYWPCSLEIHYTLTTEIRILHKIYTFVEAQQKGNRVKSFFRQGEISTLLKDCQAGLQQSFDFFHIEETRALLDIAEMKKDAQKRHQEALDMIEKLSEATTSERASTISGHHSWSSKPKIFHGRESELSDILHLFNTGIPRIAILGAGGMGKTSLARAVLHHPDIMARYVQNRFFVVCNSATTGIELANLIGSHLGLKPGKNLTQAMLQYFTNNPPSLLILDELEPLWEPASSRANIEELLSLLTGVEDLALMITMRGAEHPAKVQWTRPFLKVLQPLDQEAARCTFVDIADSGHSLEEIDQILSLTDNMPLAISLLAHLADTEGCSNVLSHWDKEKTSVISEGVDKRSNLDMSISLSLSSPRIHSIPHSQELLSLLAMLPDGLTDVDLIQSKLPLENILTCKTTLKSTALAYSDEHKRLKVLMPIREYLQQHQPPGDHLVQSLFKYFQEMLAFYVKYVGTQSISSTVPQLKSNHTNIQNVLQWGLKQKQPNLSNSIYCVQTPLIGQIQDLLPQLNDHRLKAYFLIELIRQWRYYSISDPEALASQVVELFKDFDDPDLKCRFYSSMSAYYEEVKNDLVGAVNMYKRLISLATQTGNTRRHSQGLDGLAWINFELGAYSEAQMDAHESQKLFRVSGDLHGEADAACTEAVCWKNLGHYKQSLSLSIRAQSLLSLCGMSDGSANLDIMNTQAEVHKCKSEYSEAWTIQTKILQISTNRSAYDRALTLLNLAEIAVSMGVQKQDVQRNIEFAKSIFTTLNLKPLVICCDAALADLYIREKDLPTAKRLFKKCLELATEHSEIKLFCLERLGNANSWGADESTPGWTTIFLMYSLKLKAKLQVYKALQFLGQMFLTHKDENTAVSLFTVALVGFTSMDVHRSRAECMTRLGDIFSRCGDLLKAVELWESARLLFERSSQAKEVQCVDERLSRVGSNVPDHHRENIARLVRLDIPSGNLSHIEDEGRVESIGDNELTM